MREMTVNLERRPIGAFPLLYPSVHVSIGPESLDQGPVEDFGLYRFGDAAFATAG
jgi:hypothetical protein